MSVVGLVVAALLGAGRIVGGGGVAAEDAGAAQATSAVLTAAIYPGTWKRSQTTPAFTLGELAKPSERSAAVRGLPGAAVATIEAALPALQSEPYALVVAREQNHPENVVACGDRNGATGEDGSTMSVGLFEQQSSLTTGIATLAADGERTTVEVYVARALNWGVGVGGSSPFGQDDKEPDVTDTVAVTLSDDDVTMEFEEIAVGSVVEFVVTNEGS